MLIPFKCSEDEKMRRLHGSARQLAAVLQMKVGAYEWPSYIFSGLLVCFDGI